MPVPMVLATWVPRTKAATKLKKAAQSTATCGESTRVETTVAMELAASWKPFRKSKSERDQDDEDEDRGRRGLSRPQAFLITTLPRTWV